MEPNKNEFIIENDRKLGNDYKVEPYISVQISASSKSFSFNFFLCNKMNMELRLMVQRVGWKLTFKAFNFLFNEQMKSKNG